MLPLILLVCALVCFLFAAFYVPPQPRPNLVALGLAFYVLSLLTQNQAFIMHR